MAKINDTTTFPNTIPALTDFVIGTDVSDTGNSADGEVVTFRFTDIFDIIPLPTRYVNTFGTSSSNTGNQIYALNGFSALVVDFSFTGTITGPAGGTINITAALSSNSGSSYGTAKTLFSDTSASTFTFTGNSKLYVTLTTGVYRGYQSEGTAAFSGTIAGGGSSVTNLRLGISGSGGSVSSIRLNGAATCVGAVKLPSEF
jgi:hypothetical protein